MSYILISYIFISEIITLYAFYENYTNGRVSNLSQLKIIWRSATLKQNYYYYTAALTSTKFDMAILLAHEEATLYCDNRHTRGRRRDQKLLRVMSRNRNYIFFYDHKKGF